VVGEPMLRAYDHQSVVVVTMKVNINQKSLTIEEMLRQRKQTVVSVAENLAREVQFDLALAKIGAGEPAPRFEDVLRGVRERDDAWFNVDRNLQDEMSRVINAKYGAIAESVRDWKRDKRPTEAVRLWARGGVGGGSGGMKVFMGALTVARRGEKGRQKEGAKGAVAEQPRYWTIYNLIYTWFVLVADTSGGCDGTDVPDARA
jgi:hypothetical protein